MGRAGVAFVSPALIGPVVSFLGTAGPIFVLGRAQRNIAAHGGPVAGTPAGPILVRRCERLPLVTYRFGSTCRLKRLLRVMGLCTSAVAPQSRAPGRPIRVNGTGPDRPRLDVWRADLGRNFRICGP
jgi:hypothetical protein